MRVNRHACHLAGPTPLTEGGPAKRAPNLVRGHTEPPPPPLLELSTQTASSAGMEEEEEEEEEEEYITSSNWRGKHNSLSGSGKMLLGFSPPFIASGNWRSRERRTCMRASSMHSCLVLASREQTGSDGSARPCPVKGSAAGSAQVWPGRRCRRRAGRKGR